MKKYKIINIVIISIFLLTALSCEKFLDQYPSTSVSSEDIFTDPSYAEAALIGLYDNLQSGDLTGRSTLLKNDLKSCDFFLLTGSGLYLVTEYNYSESSMKIGSAALIWRKGYETIKDCNNFLAGIEGLEGNQEKINDLKAQAKTIKAIAYMELLKVFCYPLNIANLDDKYSLGIPLVRNKIETVEAIENGIERAQLTEVISYIEDLLETSVNEIDPSRLPGAFISKPTIYGILANVYLYQEKWTEAANAASEAASAGSMIPYDQYLTEIRSDFNDECLFELMYTTTDNLVDRMPGFIINMTVNENNRHDETSVGYGEIGASDTFLDLLNENPADIRIQLLHEDKTSTAPLTITDPVHGEDGYSARYYYKYIGCKGGSPYLHNTPYIRIPEVLLIAAEAYSEIPGNDNIALEYLNEVYETRTGTVLTGLTGQALKDEIFKERRRELALEGHGIYDFVRKNRSFTRDDSHHTYVEIDPSTQAGRDNDYFHKIVYPIPIEEMDANPKIRNQQNPGYTPYQGSE